METQEQKNQQESERGTRNVERKEILEGLPMKDSPYLQYDDLEDYKRKAYGTEGHQDPKEGRGAGSTDAPTLSGGVVTSEVQVPLADAMHGRSNAISK